MNIQEAKNNYDILLKYENSLKNNILNKNINPKELNEKIKHHIMVHDTLCALSMAINEYNNGLSLVKDAYDAIEYEKICLEKELEIYNCLIDTDTKNDILNGIESRKNRLNDMLKIINDYTRINEISIPKELEDKIQNLVKESN